MKTLYFAAFAAIAAAVVYLRVKSQGKEAAERAQKVQGILKNLPKPQVSRCSPKAGDRTVPAIDRDAQKNNLTKPIFNTDSSIPYFKEKLAKYGFGSCGPRGFLGTYTSHLLLEKDLEQYFDQPAIIFSSNATVVCSAIGSVQPDFVIVFEGASYGIQRLKEQQKCFEMSESRFLKQDFSEDLKFLLASKLNGWVVFDSTADVAKVVAAAEQLKLRTLMNELGFLQLGSQRRGTCQALQEKGVHIRNADIDLISASFEDVFGIQGGCCSGAQLVIGNMRTAAAGYCFSASAPPALMDVVRHAMR